MTKRDEDLIEEGREFSDEELEQYFKEAEEEEAGPKSFFATPIFRRLVVIGVAVVLFVQVLAFWPQLFSMDAIRFLNVSARLSQSEDIREYKQSVVVIRTDDGKGTGFVVSEDGLIVTNRHVVDDGSHPIVSLPNGERHIAEIIYMSEEVDLALLDIDAQGLPVLSLGDYYAGEAGTSIYVIGNPLFFSGIANEGETYGITNSHPSMMVLQAPIYKGNSGSPVIAVNGEVIGVVYATSTVHIDGKRENIGLAVPIEWVHHMLMEAKDGAGNPVSERTAG